MEGVISVLNKRRENNLALFDWTEKLTDREAGKCSTSLRLLIPVGGKVTTAQPSHWVENYTPDGIFTW